MKTIVPLIAMLATGCAVGLDVPEGVDVACDSDADCVAGQICAPSGLCVTELSTSALALLAAAAIDSNQVRLIFDQPIVSSAARDPENYTITPSLAVLDAYRDEDNAAVILRTEDQVFGSSYTVTVDRVVGVGGTLIDPAAASAVFIGFGTPADTTPPTPLAPSDDALAVGLSQVLVWSARIGATQYSVKVATNADCAAPLISQTLSAEVTSLEIVLPATGVYHWCVSSNLSSPAESHGVFHITDDAIYVFCAAGATCAASPSEVGSPDAPMRSVQRAVALAQQLGLPAVRIASRGPAAAYDEAVHVTGVGIELAGGYDASFTIVDAVAHPTSIRFASSALILSGLSGPMLVTGLRFTGDTTYAPVAIIANNTDQVTFRDVWAHADGPGNATGVRLADSTEATLERTTITTSQTNQAVGLRCTSTGVLRVVESLILPGNAVGLSASSRALLADHSQLEVRATTMITGTSSSEAKAFESTGPVSISDSLIVAREATLAVAARIDSGTVERSRFYANASFVGTGVFVDGHPVTIRDNVVVVEGGNTTTVGLELNDVNGITRACADGAGTKVIGNTIYSSKMGIELHAGSPVITNNLIAAETTCFFENPVVGYDTADPLSFQNNALVGCTTPYGERRGAPGEITSTYQPAPDAAAVNALNGSPCREETGLIVRYSGNVAGSVNDNVLFTDLDGADGQFFETGPNDVSETADNDFSLMLNSDVLGIRGGGKVGNASDCGDGAVACGGAAVDLRGTPRTVPWSIGAYEKD